MTLPGNPSLCSRVADPTDQPAGPPCCDGGHNRVISAQGTKAPARQSLTNIRQGALTEGGGAQRPLTYCDGDHLPDMLLVACWPELRAVGFSYSTRRQTGLPQLVGIPELDCYRFR
jgi:hypothetical protein